MLDVTALKRVARIGSLATAKELSPNLHLTKDTPPTILFYGTDDSLLVHGKTYIENAETLGFEAVLYTADKARHGFFNRDPWMNKTLCLSDLFLIEHGYLQGIPELTGTEKTIMSKIHANPRKTD